MRIPDGLVATTTAREGAAGRSWLAGLPTLAEELITAWGCRPGGPPRHGGVALVLPVIAPAGPAVIKISFPHEGNRGEPEALRLLDGDGAVRLWAHDQDRWAMLLERADGMLPSAELSTEASIELLGEFAARFARVPAPGLRRLSDTVPGWRDQLERQRAAAPAGSVADRSWGRTLAALEAVAGDPTTTLLHGDLHEGNVLGADREPWLTVDHKGWAGTAAHDAWTVALTRPAELASVASPGAAIEGRIRRFATAAGVDAELCREVAHARAVSSLLYEIVTDADTVGLALLREVVDRG